jgi:hypothetical protein
MEASRGRGAHRLRCGPHEHLPDEAGGDAAHKLAAQLGQDLPRDRGDIGQQLRRNVGAAGGEHKAAAAAAAAALCKELHHLDQVLHNLGPGQA